MASRILPSFLGIPQPAPRAASRRGIALNPKLLAVFFLVSALGIYVYWIDGEIRHPPGVLIASQPSQARLQKKRPWKKEEYVIIPLARFGLEARVLGAERYRLDRGSDLAPVDLALGWGPMSDQQVLDQLEISQGSRFYFWSAGRLPLPPAVIATHSANMHMIPADSDIDDRLKSLRAGHLIRLKGYLVAVQAPDGWRWKSSLTRRDTGNGACELVWVEELATL